MNNVYWVLAGDVHDSECIVLCRSCTPGNWVVGPNDTTTPSDADCEICGKSGACEE